MSFTIESSLIDQSDEDHKKAIAHQAMVDTLQPLKAISRHIPRAEQLRGMLLDLFVQTMEGRGREALDRLIDEKPEIYFALAVRLLPSESKATVDVRHSLVESVRRSRQLGRTDISVEPKPPPIAEGRVSSPDQG